MTATTKNVNRGTRSASFGSLAPLTNVLMFTGMMDRVASRHSSLPGMGAFTGFSGDGKTSAATYAANKTQAYYIEVGSTWTQAKFCQALSIELGIPPKGTIAAMVDGIISNLAITQRPLIIDEFDHVVNRKYVETVREIHDKSGAPIILIGEEMLPDKLRQWERFHNRVMYWEQSQPCDLGDADILCTIYAPGIEVAPDLLQKIVDQANGNTRRIAVNIDRARELAELEGWKKIDLAKWGKQPFFTGASPATRRR
jgi:DNA transposition AAA+ family ATPase